MDSTKKRKVYLFFALYLVLVTGVVNVWGRGIRAEAQQELVAITVIEASELESNVELTVKEEDDSEYIKTNVIDKVEPVVEVIEEVPVVEEPKITKVPIDMLYNSSVKTCMDVGKITKRTSPQWEYLTSLDCIELVVDPDGVERLHVKDESGLITTDDGYIGIALGSYFGDIGDKFIFELDSGQELKVVKVESKANKDTIKGYIHNTDSSVIEFVCDFSKMEDKKISNEYPYNGNFDNAPEFEGKIVAIWGVEELDTSAQVAVNK